jgi:hypothetical protein
VHSEQNTEAGSCGNGFLWFIVKLLFTVSLGAMY